jgi:hypothetical protein
MRRRRFLGLLSWGGLMGDLKVYGAPNCGSVSAARYPDAFTCPSIRAAPRNFMLALFDREWLNHLNETSRPAKQAD